MKEEIQPVKSDPEIILPGQAGHRRSSSDGMTARPRDADGAKSGAHYVRVLWNRKWAVLLVMLLGAAAGLTIALRQTPLYQASTTLEVQAPNDAFLGLGALNPNAGNQSFLQTEIGLLQSATLMRNTIKRLEATSRKPTAYDPSAWARLKKSMGFGASAPTYRWGELVSLTADSVTVGTVGETTIVQITCASPDPSLAADLLNALTAEFIEETAQSRWATFQKTDEWLKSQLDSMRGKVENTEQELQQYSEKKQLLYTGDNANLAEDKLKKLQDEYQKAQGDLLSKRAQKEIIDSAHGAELNSAIDLFDTGPVHETEQKLRDLQRELADLSVAFTAEHYKVRRVRAQIADLQATLAAQRNAFVFQLTNDYRTLERHATLLKVAYDTQTELVLNQAGKAIRYNTLKHEVASGRELYQAMLQRVNEAGLALALRSSNIRVIDAADAANRPFLPDIKRSGMLGLVTGVLGGVFLAFALESVNRHFKTPMVAANVLDLRLLGAIPSKGSDPVFGKQLGGAPRKKFLNVIEPRSRNAKTSALELITLHRKPSLLAESFRNTLSSILLADADGRAPQVLLVTSPGSEEGKTTITCNLTLAMAEINKKVLVVDADMRKPRIHAVFDLPNTWGLSDLLGQNTDLDEVPLEALVKRTRIPGVYALPSGPPPASVASLLHSGRFHTLMTRLRQEFDVILIDTPPALGVADTRVMSRYVDAVVLVVRANRTTRTTSLATVQKLAEDGAPVLGLILNDWDPRASDEYGASYYSMYAVERTEKRSL